MALLFGVGLDLAGVSQSDGVAFDIYLTAVTRVAFSAGSNAARVLDVISQDLDDTTVVDHGTGADAPAVLDD